MQDVLDGEAVVASGLPPVPPATRAMSVDELTAEGLPTAGPAAEERRPDAD